jgi:hypothetical protein
VTGPADHTVSQALAEAVRSPALALAVEGRAEGVPALGRLSSVGRRVVAKQAATELGEVLDVDVLGVVEKAWCTHDRLVAAGYRTVTSGGQEVVELGRHTVTSTHRPTVDVVVDDVVAVTVAFALKLQLDIASLVAVVRAGSLVAVHPGRCTLKASLSCEGVDLPSATATVTLPGSVDLGEGRRLVPKSFRAAEVPVPPQPRPSSAGQPA